MSVLRKERDRIAQIEWEEKDRIAQIKWEERDRIAQIEREERDRITGIEREERDREWDRKADFDLLENGMYIHVLVLVRAKNTSFNQCLFEIIRCSLMIP